MTIEGVEGTTVNLLAREGWLPFPRQDIPHTIIYLERRRDAFRHAAGYLELELRTFGHGTGTADPAEPA